MKRNIRLLLLSVLTPLLCLGVSFGNDPYIVKYDLCNCAGNFSSCLTQHDREDIEHLFNDSPVCFDFVFEDNLHIMNMLMINGQFMGLNYQFDNSVINKAFGLCDSNISRLLSSFDRISFQGNANMCQSIPMTITFYDNSSFGGDCSSVESELSTCQSNYSSCQSDLASCTNSCDTLVSQCQNEKSQCLSDKSEIQGSYSGCLDSLSSLNEYNTSLNDQLQACLISGSTTTGDFTIYEYQLSRNDGYSDLYLPITNSIKLPYGYRGFLDDGVLAIKQLNSLDFQYSIEDSDFQEKVVGSYSVVYLFLMSSGLFLIFIYVIRRYFIGLKSVK